MKRLIFLSLFLVFSVHATTGNMELKANKHCDQHAGQADSYVLALSWQPGFCETHGFDVGKSECLHLSQKAWHYNHLVLHGLWPNQSACGVNYGFCEVEPRSNHCDYQPLALTAAAARELKQKMPSYAYGSCLERHEWNKHGTCQALSTSDYFILATRLTDEVNQSGLRQFLLDNQGQQVSLLQIQQVLKASFGQSGAEKIHLGCKGKVLVDILIQLPAQIPCDASLNQLLPAAPNGHQNQSCPKIVKISDAYAQGQQKPIGLNH